MLLQHALIWNPIRKTVFGVELWNTFSSDCGSVLAPSDHNNRYDQTRPAITRLTCCLRSTRSETDPSHLLVSDDSWQKSCCKLFQFVLKNYTTALHVHICKPCMWMYDWSACTLNICTCSCEQNALVPPKLLSEVLFGLTFLSEPFLFLLLQGPLL